MTTQSKKLTTLKWGNSVILYEWLKTEAVTIRKIRESREVTAARASQALGFTITHTHITRCSKTIPKLTPWPYSSKRYGAKSRDAICALAVEVINLSKAQNIVPSAVIFKLARVPKP